LELTIFRRYLYLFEVFRGSVSLARPLMYQRQYRGCSRLPRSTRRRNRHPFPSLLLPSFRGQPGAMKYDPRCDGVTAAPLQVCWSTCSPISSHVFSHRMRLDA
jgi:hypothetical protein